MSVALEIEREELHTEAGEHRCNFSQFPNLLLDDVAAGRLHASAVILYWHYSRVSFANHGRSVRQTLREVEESTGLARSTITACQDELVACNWIGVRKSGTGKGQKSVVTFRGRWRANCQGHAGESRYVQKLDKTPGPDGSPGFLDKPGRKLDKSGRFLDINAPSLPPVNRRRLKEVTGEDPVARVRADEAEESANDDDDEDGDDASYEAWVEEQAWTSCPGCGARITRQWLDFKGGCSTCVRAGRILQPV